jgi:hypothetical protein
MNAYLFTLQAVFEYKLCLKNAISIFKDTAKKMRIGAKGVLH